MFKVKDTLKKNISTTLHVSQNKEYLRGRCKSVSLVDISYQAELKEVQHRKW